MAEVRVHRSAAAPPGVRGAEFGAANRDAVRSTLGAYRRLFAAARDMNVQGIRAAGATVRAHLRLGRPRLAAELDGLADGAEVDRGELYAANARTEIMAGALRSECTTLAVREGDRLALMQNWDWHPDLAQSRVVWIVEQEEGAWFATFTEAGLLGKIGLNGHGLALCLNLLATDADGGLDGLPVHLALRLVLEGCASVPDVERLLRRVSLRASSCMTVLSAAGELAVFEARPGRPPLRPAVAGSRTAHTNHFVADLPDGTVDVLRRDWPDTDRRLARATARLRSSATDAETLAVLGDHGDGPISICCHDADNPVYLERQQTLASIVLRPLEREMLVAWGQPCRADYESIALPRGMPSRR